MNKAYYVVVDDQGAYVVKHYNRVIARYHVPGIAEEVASALNQEFFAIHEKHESDVQKALLKHNPSMDGGHLATMRTLHHLINSYATVFEKFKKLKIQDNRIRRLVKDEKNLASLYLDLKALLNEQ